MKSVIAFTGILINLLSACFTNNEGSNYTIQEDSTIYGIVVKVIDGDTYVVLKGEKSEIKVRMEGIDAPEKGMPYYRKAKTRLSDLCFNKEIRLEIHDTDSHGRIIAFSYLTDSTELSHEMIRSGLAWHFKKYNNDSDLALLETEAKKLKVGLWVDNNPMPPWVNRELHRSGISTKDSFYLHEMNQ